MGEQVLEHLIDAQGADAVEDLDHRLGNAEMWQRWLALEADRFERYQRTVTIATILLLGTEEQARWFGEQIVRESVDTLLSATVRGTRDSDLVALIAPGEVGIIMPETDEIQAIHVMDRIEEVFEDWNNALTRSVAMEHGGIQLAVGWASADKARGFSEAIAIGLERRVAARRDLGYPPSLSVVLS